MIGQGQDWTGQNWKDVIGRDRIGGTGVELYMGQGRTGQDQKGA
jgi:hypothetical protein